MTSFKVIVGGICTILFVTVQNAAALESIGRGPGVNTCGVFAKAYAADPTETEMVYFSWAQGFMTAMNYTVTDVMKAQTFRNVGEDIEVQRSRLRSYCNEHPLAQFSDAVTALYSSLPFG